MRYTYKNSDHWRENPEILEQELTELQAWLHRSNIDPEFDRDTHVYQNHNTGDAWLFLPELTERQEMAATLILCSSELYRDDAPVRYSHPPNAKLEDYAEDL